MSGGRINVGVCVLLAVCLGYGLVEAKKLVVVLVDGVRWDYIQDPELKGIHRIIENGVKAPYVVPIFPSLSYPNWYTLTTGLYAENHGFVGNYIFDNETNESFKMIPAPGSTDPRWWSEADPVWITAEQNDKRSALYWWGGCEVRLRDTHPTICERQFYDGPPLPEIKVDFTERIDDMVELFKPSKNFPGGRLSLAMFYYVSVDHEGHYHAPNLANTKAAMRDIDAILETMQNKLEQAGLQDEVNIMVISDHGMTDVRSFKYISLDKYAPKIKYQMEFGGVSMIVPEPGMQDVLEIEMQFEDGLNVFKKENIPEIYHIKNNRKTPDILLVAKKGYYIKTLEDRRKVIGGNPKFQGHHGYDPYAVEDMRTVFFATGPDFRKGFETEVLHNTDLYNIMCRVLQINPKPNNGSWERVQSMLAQEPTHPYSVHSSSHKNNNISVLTSIVVTFGTLFSLAKFRFI